MDRARGTGGAAQAVRATLTAGRSHHGVARTASMSISIRSVRPIAKMPAITDWFHEMSKSSRDSWVVAENPARSPPHRSGPAPW